ncbi:MAG: oxidoreductase domain protein [Bryobacterales bacterium]|nr:oxidoreductase domain protein [Bryobacterales bacterium]
MHSRRAFVEGAASLAGTLLAPSVVLGANDRIRVGIIGPGVRGQQIMRAAINCPNVEFVGIADIFTRRQEEAKKMAPAAKTYLDYRHLLEDKSVDAVLIATPQHLHAEHFVAAMDAGKHVYQEKTMAFTVEHAKRMRAAFQRAGKRVVQIGHQGCSMGQVTDAFAFMKTGYVGQISTIHSHMYRPGVHGTGMWTRPITPDMTSENIVWKLFQGDSQPHDFDPNRYLNWRFYWDYSGGNFYENMCHQVAFWYKVLDLQIPTAVTTVGGVYLVKDGREVPDIMNASMQHDDKLLFTWDSGFGNGNLGITEHVLGLDGTIINGSEMGGPIRYVPEKRNRPDGVEMMGPTKENTKDGTQAHMQNFIDCIRSGNTPNAPFDLGFRVAIACRMAVDSYRRRRTLTWDSRHETVGVVSETA